MISFSLIVLALVLLLAGALGMVVNRPKAAGLAIMVATGSMSVAAMIRLADALL